MTIDNFPKKFVNGQLSMINCHSCMRIDVPSYIELRGGDVKVPLLGFQPQRPSANQPPPLPS